MAAEAGQRSEQGWAPVADPSASAWAPDLCGRGDRIRRPRTGPQRYASIDPSLSQTLTTIVRAWEKKVCGESSVWSLQVLIPASRTDAAAAAPGQGLLVSSITMSCVCVCVVCVCV